MSEKEPLNPPIAERAPLKDLEALEGAASLILGCDHIMFERGTLPQKFNAELGEAKELIKQIATSPTEKAVRIAVLTPLRSRLNSVLLVEAIDVWLGRRGRS